MSFMKLFKFIDCFIAGERDDIVKLLLSNGAHPDYIDLNGIPLLHHAAYFGFEKIVKILIANNATVNIKDRSNTTGNSYCSSDMENIDSKMNIIDLKRENVGSKIDFPVLSELFSILGPKNFYTFNAKLS